MRNSFLISVCAVSLTLSCGAAFAQSMDNRKEEPRTEHAQPPRSGEPQERMQRERSEQPAEKHAAEQKPSASPDRNASKSDERDRNEHAQGTREERPGEARKQNAEEQTKKPGEESKKAEDARKNDETNRKAATEERSNAAKQADRQKNETERNQQSTSTTKPQTGNQANRDETNQRNGAQPNAAVRGAENNKLPQEKVSRISTTMGHERLAAPERDVNFRVAIGAEVPGRVHFYPLPAEIVSIEPEYRDYQYFATDDDYVIVDPRSHMVVNTIPRDVSNARAEMAPSSAGGYAAAGGTANAGGTGDCQIQRSDAGQTVGSSAGNGAVTLVMRGNCEITVAPAQQ